MNLGQGGVVEQDLKVGAAAPQGGHQNTLKLDAQVRRISFARYIHQARNKAVKRIAPSEQPQALTLTQRQNSCGGVKQLVVRNLEQIVPWKRLQCVLQRFGQVTSRRQTRTLHHGIDLAPQERDLADPRAVDGRGKQTNEPVLAHHGATGVVTFNTDVVGVTGPVHCGAGIRLGHDQHRHGIARLRPSRLRQRQKSGRQRRALLITQNTEATARHPLQGRLPFVGNQVM